MTAAELDGWNDAEAIAVAHVRARRPDAARPIVARHLTLPYLFSVAAAPPAVLVHGGTVIEPGGLPALRTYAEASGLYDRDVDVLDMQYLLHALDAWPPTARHDRVAPDDYWLASRDHRPLHPRVERRGGRVALHLYYPLGSGRGALPEPDPPVRVAEWILVLEPGTDPLWTRAERRFSLGRDRWVE